MAKTWATKCCSGTYKNNYQLCCGIKGNVTPVVRIIDDWFKARSLGMIVEVKIGKGSLMLCGVDLLTDAQKRPEATQMMNSLLDYMKSDLFNPTAVTTCAQVESLFR